MAAKFSDRPERKERGRAVVWEKRKSESDEMGGARGGVTIQLAAPLKLYPAEFSAQVAKNETDPR